MNQSIATGGQQLGLAILRLALGAMWLAHALLKLLVFTLPGTADYFASIGLPGALAYPVFALEVAGGAALLAGIYPRQVALLLTPILLAAAWAHLPNGWVHTSSGGGWEYPLFLALVSVAYWLMGDGALCLRRSSRLCPTQA